MAHDIAPRLKSAREIDIENVLREYAFHRDPRIQAHFKYVPPYLRDLLMRVSMAYVHQPGCYLQLLMRLLSDFPHDILFLVMNYDDLLEQALSYFDSQFNFNNMNDYVADGRSVKVIKLHGSINWFRAIDVAGASWEDAVKRLDIFSPAPDIKVNRITATFVDGMIIGGHIVYPVITAPLAAKSLEEAVCPGDHISIAREFLSDCEKFLIVGTSGLDEDLFSLLNTAISSSSRPYVLVVGGDSSGTATTVERFQNGVAAFQPGQVRAIDKSEEGFKTFVSGEDIVEFSRFDPSSRL